jgi:hypothetical protein
MSTIIMTLTTNHSLKNKIVWEISHGELELFEDATKFSDIVLSNFNGKFLAYSNKDAKYDVDIHKIVIENHCDSAEYKMVLFPGYSLK